MLVCQIFLKYYLNVLKLDKNDAIKMDKCRAEHENDNLDNTVILYYIPT